MLIHRYLTEFSDDGSRATLPVVEMGVGLAGYSHRWKASTLAGIADGGVIQNWVDSIAGTTITSSNQKPVMATVNGTRVIAFDGVDDELNGAPLGSTGYADPNNHKTVTFVVRIRSHVAGTAKGIANLGGGCLEMDATSGMLRARTWFNASGAGGTSQGNTLNQTSLFDQKFAVISVVATHDGLHELSVGKNHAAGVNPQVPQNGMNALAIGRSTPGSFAAMDLVEVLTWPAELTRAERDKVDTGLKLNYPSLTFV
jgi:hypothetical protein